MPDLKRMPFGKQFSPNQVDLPVLLELAVQHVGDRPALQQAIESAFWAGKGQPAQLAMNTFLAMRDFGLVSGDQPYAVTALCTELHGLRATPQQMYVRFARHIVTDLHGLTLLDVVRARTARGERLNAQDIARDLLDAGVDPGSENGEKLNPIRLYLEKAGVFEPRKWAIVDAGLTSVVGTSAADLDVLVSMPHAQRAFLRALATATGTPPYDSQRIADMAVRQSGARFNRKNIPKDILAPLESSGWITATKTTGGRGAKAHTVAPTPKFTTEINEPLARALIDQASLSDPTFLRKPFTELLQKARAATATGARGYALEGICLHVMRMMGARFVAWRYRGADTGNAEVDLVAEHLVGGYQLIQMQSKVSAITTRDIVDREVGVSVQRKTNIILFITAREVGNAAREAARRHMLATNLSILFIDGADLDRVSSGVEIVDALEREFKRVRDVRLHQHTAT